MTDPLPQLVDEYIRKKFGKRERSRVRAKRKKKSRTGKLGIVRLHGEDLEELRRACFERDRYRCQYPLQSPGVLGWIYYQCGSLVTWETGHMAHIRTKRNNGDTLGNVRTLCAECHMKEHNAGGKPCPPKPSKRLSKGE